MKLWNIPAPGGSRTSVPSCGGARPAEATAVLSPHRLGGADVPCDAAMQSVISWVRFFRGVAVWVSRVGLPRSALHVSWPQPPEASTCWWVWGFLVWEL